jgi:hypothetical protein
VSRKEWPHISCPISRKPSKRNDANVVALFASGQCLAIHTTNRSSRDGHVAHVGQDLELECLCELQAIEAICDRKTYGKEEEIEPAADVSA